jgi:4-amino-4-deoxy-L-arabinose transferase-like glycosyltransferase
MAVLKNEVINWDESTFAIMAQDVLRHHMPYVTLFDNKPPGMFLVLAGAMGVFGQSLATVRVFGIICLLMSAITMFAVTRRFVDDTTAGLSTLVMMAAASAPVGLYTSSEKPTMLLLATAILVILTSASKWWSAWCVGILASIATLIRSNIAFVVIFVGFLYSVALLPSLRIHRLSAVFYALGGMLPMTILVGLYVYAGAFKTLILYGVVVPLFYAGKGISTYHAFFHNIHTLIISDDASACFWLFVLLSVIGACLGLGGVGMW